MNEKVRTIVFRIGAVALLLGAALYLIRPLWASYIFAVGAAGVAISYLTLPTHQFNFRVKRLHRLNIFASLLCIVASGLMFSQRKEWVLCLFIAAILQLYTAFVTPRNNT